MPQTKPPVRHQLSKFASSESSHQKHQGNEDERILAHNVEIIYVDATRPEKKTVSSLVEGRQQQGIQGH